MGRFRGFGAENASGRRSPWLPTSLRRVLRRSGRLPRRAGSHRRLVVSAGCQIILAIDRRISSCSSGVRSPKSR